MTYGVSNFSLWCRELLSSTALLQPFLEEWTGPLPQGFSAIAAAKGIALKQPLSLAPALLQAMRQNLRHTSLSAALQVRLIYPVALLLHSGMVLTA